MITDKWTDTIDQTTKDFIKAFGELNAEQLNWKPDSQTWSIAQNLDHLIVLNGSYFSILDAIRNGNYKVPFIGKVGFAVNFIGKTILKSVQPDRKKKMQTFPLWEPSKSDLTAEILVRFVKHQEDLKQKIKNCEDLLGKGIRISSPVNRNIVYNLETAFDIIVTHEQRHLEQAKEILSKQIINTSNASKRNT